MKSQYRAPLLVSALIVISSFVVSGCAMGSEQDAAVSEEMSIDQVPAGTDEAALESEVHQSAGMDERSPEAMSAGDPASEESQERAQTTEELGTLDEPGAACNTGKADFGSEPASKSCDHNAGEVDHGSPQPLDPQPAPNDDENSESDGD